MRVRQSRRTPFPLYNWYFYMHLIFAIFRAPHDSTKMTSLK